VKAILNGGALLVGLVAITISLIGLHRINTRCGAAPTPTASTDPEWASKELDAKVAVANVQLEQAGRVFVKPFVCTLKPTTETNYACNKAIDDEYRRLSRGPDTSMDSQPSFARGMVCPHEGERMEDGKCYLTIH
jgi:hypothetical protein